MGKKLERWMIVPPGHLVSYETVLIICDWLWQKGYIRAHNEFSVFVVLRHLIFFYSLKKNFFWLSGTL